jgi:23S rRNA (guanosine2251-2'-O)-methyltransferase
MGRRAVLEALRAGKRQITRLYALAGGSGGPFPEITSLAKSRGIDVKFVSRPELDELSRGGRHQGVVLIASTGAEASIETLLENAASCGEPAFFAALDELKDPHNVGAIIRTAEGAGLHGIVTTINRSAARGPGMERSSAGAVEYFPVARVVNLRDALMRLKDAGCWVIGADASGGKELTEADLTRPLVLVLGEEGKGLRDLTLKTCDETVRIPLAGKIQSLNVSVSAGILFFEVVRQRRIGAPRERGRKFG